MTKLFVYLATLTFVMIGCYSGPAYTAYSKNGMSNNRSYSQKSPPKSTPVAAKSVPITAKPVNKPASDYLSNMGYTVQVGAFKNVDNAVALVEKLDYSGLDPYYFKASDGMYKVRFGNFNTLNQAKLTVQDLQNRKIISEHYILSPDDYTVAKQAPKGTSNLNYIRRELVATAKNYLNVPYRWGGTSKKGIDCSGLTQAIYNLNGLSIPRNSRAQFDKGKSISKNSLQPGDLVFFATGGGKRVSHVGIYIGNGQFIHAPGRGKRVVTAPLSDKFFTKTYVGSKSYL